MDASTIRSRGWYWLHLSHSANRKTIIIRDCHPPDDRIVELNRMLFAVDAPKEITAATSYIMPRGAALLLISG